MAFDGLVTYTVVQELKSCLMDGKIDKIFEPNSDEIILGIYCNGIKYALDIVTSPQFYRICITTHNKSNPNFAPSFCMLLRKYLLNTRIVKIQTYSLERVLSIEFEGHSKSDDNSPKKLIIELMGKHSNIILVNSNNIIIDALKHFTTDNNSYRNIIPNALYTLPISRKLDFMKIENSYDFYISSLNFIKENKFNDKDFNINDLKLSDLVINTYMGICKTSIMAILNELHLPDVFCENNMKILYKYLSEMLQSPNNVIIKSLQSNDYFPILEKNDTNEDLQVSLFIDEYYVQREINNNFNNYRNNLSKLILGYFKKLDNKLSNINIKLQECQNMDLYRLYGELITNNLYRINNEHSEKIILENYYDNNSLISIPLDKTISPYINAKKYFKKYHKLKNAKEIVESQKKEVELELNYLESIVYEFELASTISEIDNIYNEFCENFLNKDITPSSQKYYKTLNKKSKASKKNQQKNSKIGTPIEYTIDGFKVLIGKNNKQNDYITKQANSFDIWFHTKDIHGSHVILKTEGKNVQQETLNKVASLAAFYSKGSLSNNVPVDYTFVQYVKKPSKAKPGMVIYTNHKNVIVKPKDYNNL